MGATADVRNWNRYIGRWRLYTDNMEDLSTFLTWYGTKSDDLSTMEIAIEAFDVTLDKSYKAVLNKAGS